MSSYKYKPDIYEMYKVLNREKPSRPVLFELFMNQTVYENLAGYKRKDETNDSLYELMLDAFHAGGYDYATVHANDFCFPTAGRDHKKTSSLNEGFVITDEKSFNEYKWPDPEGFDYNRLDKLGKKLPDGMKLMVIGPCGVLENAIMLLGYENMCFLLADEPELVELVFENIGTRLLKYYQAAAAHEAVGIVMVNDDWGFNTQTFLSPKDMRKYVFPWHKKIVEVAHENKKPAILHSCGNAFEIMDDIIDGIKFNGKHSFEDVIMPVEENYKIWGKRVGIIGGMDVDFLIRSSPEEIRNRCEVMLELAEENGSYALGSGNSVPEYIPYEHYRAMIDVALSKR